jgi:hypothetical protein
VRLRAGLEQAPPEVAQCLKAELGENIITDIQEGKLTPGPEIGERVRGCFERFGNRGGAHEMFRNVPPEISSCLKERLGSDIEKIRKGELQPTPEMADTMRVCFELRRWNEGEGEPHREGGLPMGRMREGADREGIREMPPLMMMRGLPPAVRECARVKLGADLETVAEDGAVSPENLKTAIRSCFEEFRPMPPGQGFMKDSMMLPEGMGSGMMEGGGRPGDAGGPARPAGGPGDIRMAADCLREKLDANDFARVMQGAQPSPENEAVIQGCVSALVGERGGGNEFFMQGHGAERPPVPWTGQSLEGRNAPLPPGSWPRDAGGTLSGNASGNVPHYAPWDQNPPPLYPYPAPAPQPVPSEPLPQTYPSPTDYPSTVTTSPIGAMALNPLRVLVRLLLGF